MIKKETIMKGGRKGGKIEEIPGWGRRNGPSGVCITPNNKYATISAINPLDMSTNRICIIACSKSTCTRSQHRHRLYECGRWMRARMSVGCRDMGVLRARKHLNFFALCICVLSVRTETSLKKHSVLKIQQGPLLYGSPSSNYQVYSF